MSAPSQSSESNSSSNEHDPNPIAPGFSYENNTYVYRSPHDTATIGYIQDFKHLQGQMEVLSMMTVDFTQSMRAQMQTMEEHMSKVHTVYLKIYEDHIRLRDTVKHVHGNHKRLAKLLSRLGKLFQNIEVEEEEEEESGDEIVEKDQAMGKVGEEQEVDQTK
jgi:hypothetical protein